MGASLCRDEEIQHVVDTEALEKHKDIEQKLKLDSQTFKRIIKILLLGSADSGKSTIAKQMKILHTNGFNETELINYRYMIHTNLINSYHFVATGIYQLKIHVAQHEQELVDRFHTDYNKFFDDDEHDQLKHLNRFRSYACVDEACKRINQFYVPDNTSYLFAQANRILKSNFTPTEMDVIHARASTTGVHEIMFAFKKFSIKLIDVGGQKTERRKWIHCFEGVTATLFVTSLSCYDQYMEDDPAKDSIDLFRSMYMNEFLLKSSFILFFNKKDLFEEKIKHTPISNYFPSIQCPNEGEQIFKIISNMFLRIENEFDRDGKKIYGHITNATDTKNIDFVFGAACEIILQNNLTRAGMT